MALCRFDPAGEKGVDCGEGLPDRDDDRQRGEEIRYAVEETAQCADRGQHQQNAADDRAAVRKDTQMQQRDEQRKAGQYNHCTMKSEF